MVASSAGNGLEQPLHRYDVTSSSSSSSSGSSDGCVQNFLHRPASTGVFISDLIQQGAEIHSTSERTRETPLHFAARFARADAAKRLLEAGTFCVC